MKQHKLSQNNEGLYLFKQGTPTLPKDVKGSNNFSWTSFEHTKNNAH